MRKTIAISRRTNSMETCFWQLLIHGFLKATLSKLYPFLTKNVSCIYPRKAAFFIALQHSILPDWNMIALKWKIYIFLRYEKTKKVLISIHLFLLQFSFSLWIVFKFIFLFLLFFPTFYVLKWEIGDQLFIANQDS